MTPLVGLLVFGAYFLYMISILPLTNYQGLTVPDWEKILPFFSKPNLSCVYAIVCDSEIVYVGTTDSLRKRIKKHFFSKNKELSLFLQSNYTKCTYAVLHNKKCFKTEAQFIKAYNPKFNKQK